MHAGLSKRKRPDHNISRPVPPTCRGVGVVELRPMARGGARLALGHITNTPSPHCAECLPWAVGRYFTVRRARGSRAIGFERGDRDLPKPVPPTCRDVGAVVPRSMAWEEPCPALAHNATMASAYCAARAPWAAARYCMIRTARGPRATGAERGGHERSKPVPPTCCGVRVVEPQPAAWRGARLALGHNTTMPGLHCAARAPWAVGRYSTRRRARWPRAMESRTRWSKNVRSQCRQPAAVLVQ